MEEQIVQIRAGLQRKRLVQKRWGQGLCALGVVTILDLWSYFPIPLVGVQAVVVGLGLVYAGLYLLYRQQELPLSEALEVAALQEGYLSGPLLVRALHVTPATADRILEEFVRRGYARVEERGLEEGEVGYRVLGLSAPPAPPALPPG